MLARCQQPIQQSLPKFSDRFDLVTVLSAQSDFDSEQRPWDARAWRAEQQNPARLDSGREAWPIIASPQLGPRVNASALDSQGLPCLAFLPRHVELYLPPKWRTTHSRVASTRKTCMGTKSPHAAKRLEDLGQAFIPLSTIFLSGGHICLG